MGEKAAELWKRGQELDGSAEELLAELREDNAERDWDRQRIYRRTVCESVCEKPRRSSED